MIDIEKALLNPAGVFETPEEVLEANDIPREEKIKILRNWEYDIRELQVAEEENMLGPQAHELDRIRNALRKLDAELDTEHSPPTKHGGIRPMGKR
jgi:hypothetical protein